jgi:hypothetical protein
VLVAVRLLPNTELVAIAYIQSIPGLTADVVATQTPADESQWQANGCITVQTIGGRPDADIPVAHPVVQLDFWAVSPGSNKPPWFKAAALAEQVRMAAYDRLRVCRIVTITAGGQVYPSARVLTAFLLTEPRRVYHDAGDYARYQGDLAMSWHPVAPVQEPI